MTPDSRRLLRPAAFPPERHRDFALGVVSRRAPHAARPTPGTEHRMQGLGMHIFQKHNNIVMYECLQKKKSCNSQVLKKVRTSFRTF